MTCIEVATAAGLQPGHQSGQEQLYRCPRHDDQHPSLSVNAAKNTWMCGPCSAAGTAWQLAAFLAALEPGDKDGVKAWLKEHGLSNGNVSPVHPISDERGPKRIVAEYKYVDEAGAHLFDVVRFQPKDFRQRKPDGTWNLNGVRRVLYRLPELLRAVDVFIVEGEKDVESLAAIGLTATCNPGGAGKWRPEYSESFKAHQHVVVIPDNDEPGRTHAVDVAAALHGKVASVKILELPGLPEKGDVSDFLAGKDPETAAEELCILADGAQLWSLGSSPIEQEPDSKRVNGSGLPLTSMAELLNEPEEQTAWLVEERLPAGGDSLCVAKPKVGKSTFARGLALAVSRGEDFLNSKTAQGPVFYLALEEKKAEVAKHFKAMGARDDDPIFVFCATSPADGLAQLKAAMADRKPVLVIVDPLFRFVRVKDNNDYAAVTNALEPLHALARETGAHVMALHHAGKTADREGGDSVLGSTAIFASVDTLLVMKRNDKYRTISSIQRYGTDLEEITLNYNEATRTMTAGLPRADADISATMKAIVDFLKTQSEPVELRVIDDAVEGRKQMKWQAMKKCLETGTTNRTGNGKRGDPYLYSISCSASSAYTAGTTEQETVTLTNDKAVSCSRSSV